MNKKICSIFLALLLIRSQFSIHCQAAAYPGLENTDIYIAEYDNVSFNTRIHIPSDFIPDFLNSYIGNVQNINWEKALQLFASDTECTYESGGISENETGTSYPYEYREFANGDMMTYGYGYFSFGTEFFYKIYNSFQLGTNDSHYPTMTNLPFESYETVFHDISEQFYSIDYPLENAYYTCFSLCHSSLQAYEYEMYKDSSGNITDDLKGTPYEPTENWSDSDDCYYFCIGQALDGLPVYHGSQVFPGNSLEHMPVQVLYSSSGIQRIDLGTPTGFFHVQNLNTPITLTTFEDIISTVKAKYMNLITDSSYTVTNATLYQFPQKQKDGTFIFTPAWLFEINETGVYKEWNDSPYVQTLYTIIDAQTGKEIVL